MYGSIDVDNIAIPAASSALYRPVDESETTVEDTAAELMATKADVEAVRADLTMVRNGDTNSTEE